MGKCDRDTSSTSLLGSRIIGHERKVEFPRTRAPRPKNIQQRTFKNCIQDPYQGNEDYSGIFFTAFRNIYPGSENLPGGVQILFAGVNKLFETLIRKEKSQVAKNEKKFA
ncbi:hypothetical protein AVEN_77015-1 [Araneus ventricosus]|uniref:Uncharacterized protein n=1 Tax=Araneus ventricosus TaxID=182803 RepID=A0A4Y2T9S9_ARAVE|nr:hypothetical protein AVEN_77015-1 [Araneus ventricosus]